MSRFIKQTCEDLEYLIPCCGTTYTAGTGISISSDNVISNTGVLSVNGQTGDVVIQAGGVTFLPYPDTFDTNGTTAQFLSSISSLHLPVGSAYLGQVSLSDMPEGVTVQGDVEVYVYPQNIIYAIMRSADVEPYQWVVDSYSNSYYGRGWIPVGNYVVESTTPSSADKGMLWYDTTNNILKIYNGTSWENVDTNTTYSAGTGINITNNVISTDNTVAMAADVNTKVFALNSTTDIVTAQAALDWQRSGKVALIEYNGQLYAYYMYLAGYIFVSQLTYVNNSVGLSENTLTTNEVWLKLEIDNNYNVTELEWLDNYVNMNYLDTAENYSTPYVPLYSGSPATKKYVDDGDTIISSSTPTGTHIEGELWYDTTNDILKAYDGTNWNSVGGSFSQVQADWNQATTTAVDYIKNKPNLATVATSGNYNDLINTPTIPTVGDGILTIQKNSSTIDTFTANASANKTINIAVPTKTSDLNNDSGFITSSSIPTVGDGTLTIQKNSSTIDTFTANSSSNKTINITIPTKTSDLNNDSGFVTSSSIPTVGDGTITLNRRGGFIGNFTTNQSGNEAITITPLGAECFSGTVNISAGNSTTLSCYSPFATAFDLHLYGDVGNRDQVSVDIKLRLLDQENRTWAYSASGKIINIDTHDLVQNANNGTANRTAPVQEEQIFSIDYSTSGSLRVKLVIYSSYVYVYLYTYGEDIDIVWNGGYYSY